MTAAFRVIRRRLVLIHCVIKLTSSRWSTDHLVLFQPFIQVAKNCTAKVKPDIIDRISCKFTAEALYKSCAIRTAARPTAQLVVANVITALHHT